MNDNKNKFFFHEDDYALTQILPATNAAFVAQQVQAIADFSQENQAEDGAGRTDCMIREEEPTPIATLKLDAQSIKALLKSSFKEWQNVETGTSSDKEPCPALTAYGEDDDCAFMVAEENGIVTELWMLLNAPDEELGEKLLDIWQKLSQQADLLLVDWGWTVSYGLEEQDDLEDYLEQRREAFEAMQQEWQEENNA